MDLFKIIVEKVGSDENLRVLTNLYSSKKYSLIAYPKALRIHSIFKKINLENSINNKNWKKKWLKKSGIKIKYKSVKDWFSGRSSIPFKAILALESFCSDEDFAEIKANCHYFCTKTSSPAKFPKEVSSDLAWLVAAILCDGHLRKNKEGIVFEVTDLNLCSKFCNIFSNVFEIPLKQPLIRNRQNYNKTYVIYLNNVPAISFLSELFEIPLGKKCSIIVVPKLIKDSSIEIKKAFLKGVFDTDGGKRGKGLGLTSLSKEFVIGVNELLKEFGVNPSFEVWVNKKYPKKCFGSRFKIDAHSIFLLRQN